MTLYWTIIDRLMKNIDCVYYKEFEYTADGCMVIVCVVNNQFRIHFECLPNKMIISHVYYDICECGYNDPKFANKLSARLYEYTHKPYKYVATKQLWI